jgi:uncharacterized protein (DUF885 family)
VITGVVLLAVLCLTAVLAAPASVAAQTRDSWVEQSNKNSQVLLEVLARWAPTVGSQLGLPGVDEEVVQLPPDVVELILADLEEAVTELEKRLASEPHPAVKQDLEILIRETNLNLEDIRLEQKYLLDYESVPEDIFRAIRVLLDEQNDPSRYPAAVVRLSRMAGLAEGYTPLTEQYERYLRGRMKNEGLLGPVREKVERDLATSDRLVAGIKELFEQYELEGWRTAFGALEQQVEGWNAFVRAEILPRCRTDTRLPPEIYAFNLRQLGVEMSVDELVSRAKMAFVEIQNEMQVLAGLVAAEREYASSDYRDVIRNLKKEQLSGEDAVKLFRQRIQEIEAIVREHDLVTLPERDLIIRLASEAETAASPAPHMNPPRLLGNTGERGEFVVPLKMISAEGEMQTDDFTFDAASWTLTVHEGRPGHEMQFASVVELGVSTARALFAINSANAEGWGLYTEAIMKPYMPLEGQLISLQLRLLRAARAFLDPGLQSGEVARDEALRILQDEVVFSEGMALQEVQRYIFESPGQATSYFFGYCRLMELRADVERILGDRFNAREFHDFILAQGVLPLSLVRQVVMEEFLEGA